MRDAIATKAYKKDVKKFRNDARVLNLVVEVVGYLILKQPLPSKFRDNALTGDFTSFRECHIRPEVLLVYEDTGDLVRMIRLGSHAAIFG